MKYSIIGAGIGGLTTGLAFEKKGINYHIFERFITSNEVGAGIWLSPNALQVFEYLDLLDAIKEKGNSIDRITIGKPDLTPISDNPQDFIKAKFGYSAIAIHRAELQKILIDKLPKGKKSYALSFTLEDENKTLTDKQIEKVMNKLQQKFRNDFGASLR